MSDNITRGHCFKIQKQYSRVNCRGFSFADRCIDAWNSLDNDVFRRPSPASAGRAGLYILLLYFFLFFDTETYIDENRHSKILLSFCMFYRPRLGMVLVSACLTIHSFSSGMSLFLNVYFYTVQLLFPATEK